MIFSSWNYKILAIGLFLVIAGFSAMYLENEVEGIISLYISPIVIMTGYITVIVAILKHDRSSSAASGQS
jgi:hypothetical protein